MKILCMCFLVYCFFPCPRNTQSDSFVLCKVCAISWKYSSLTKNYIRAHVGHACSSCCIPLEVPTDKKPNLSGPQSRSGRGRGAAITKTQGFQTRVFMEFFRGRPRGGDNFTSLCQVLQTLYSLRVAARRGHPVKHRLKFCNLTTTILTEMMADEFNFLRPEIKNYKAEADADLIPIPGQLELHGRCRCGVLLSKYFCSLYLLQI